MSIKFIGIASALLISHSVVAGNIYQWKENGKTQFGQFPPPGISAKPVNTSRGSSDRQPKQRTPQDRLKRSENRKNEQRTQDEMKQEQQKYVKARELNCNKARHNLTILQAGGRHRIQLPDGTIKYLDEAETTNKVNAAKKNISELCRS
ncbi:MAG: DUF4124 domain-containing protein [Gammaproteobacteria bacterium]